MAGFFHSGKGALQREREREKTGHELLDADRTHRAGADALRKDTAVNFS